ncbi:MAG TPA: hypothetical protein VM433_04780, partial [Mycobacteriales bacterium]|nr:hypothetical protein [Mycobacteriales bacterium]
MGAATSLFLPLEDLVEADGLAGQAQAADDVDVLPGFRNYPDPFAGPAVDPLLLEDGGSELAAAWQQVFEHDRQATVLHVQRCRAVARGYVLARQAGCDRHDAVAELMGTLSVSRPAAEAVLDDALLLVAHPTSAVAAGAGRFGLPHLKALLRVLDGLNPDVADAVERQMLPRMPGRPPASITEMARRIALRLDPAGAAERRREAARTRRMNLRDAGDGMVELTLLMRAEQGLAILHRAERETLADDGSGRTRDQRRLDWTVDTLLADPGPAGQNGDSDRACAQDADDGPVPAPAPRSPAAGSADPAPGSALVLDGRRRRPAQIVVHMPVSTALGLDDEPCDLAEIGPVDAALGRQLLATAELRKACVDAVTGQVLHVEDTVVRPVADRGRIRQLRRHGLTGEQALAQAQAEAVRAALLDMVHTPSVAPVQAEPQYRPSAGLSRLVKTRQPRCDFLTCRCPSRTCDDEHTRPWPHGPTRADNLAPRSRWCHQRKQNGWT